MYPYEIFFGIDLYTLLLCVGIIAALLTFRIFSDRKKMYWKIQNFAILVGVFSIVVGYGSAVLFQAFYNFLADTSKEFVINRGTGATFYGGLIGGALCFLIFYFGIGAILFKKEKQHLKAFFDIANIAAASIAIAHAFGRLGCFMAGCCHGAPTDAWYGVYFDYYKIKAVPIQLFEAIFLFALFGFFVYRIIKNRTCNLPIYMVSYGIWRFIVEFFRGDDRGATVVSFLTPSQLIAILMIFGAIALFFGERYIEGKMLKKPDTDAVKNEIETQAEGSENDG